MCRAEHIVQALLLGPRIERTLVAGGVATVHRETGPLFQVEQPDFGAGLEALAEDGDKQVLLAKLATGDRGPMTFGPLDTPIGADAAAAAAPGQAYEVRLEARPGDMLSFATMFVASNDWFFASPPEGIPLFLGEFPRWEDVTPGLGLYDHRQKPARANLAALTPIETRDAA